MIGPGNGVRVYLAAGITDMRCGMSGLCARAKRSLEEDPASGAVFVFRGRMGDRLKILHWDGQGFCLYDTVLEHGHFPWPKAMAGKVSLTPAQLAMLWAPLAHASMRCRAARHGLASAAVDDRAHPDVEMASFLLVFIDFCAALR